MREIADGVVDRDGVTGLASRLGYSTRQLNRLLSAELGASALELARAQRAHTARLLLELTSLQAGEVAFAAGFGSIRQFNDTVRTVFGETPQRLRARRSETKAPGGDPGDHPGGGTVSLRLPFRPPFAAAQLFGFLAARAAPGIEAGDGRSYVRSLSLPGGAAIVRLDAPHPGDDFLRATLKLQDMRDVTTTVKRLRQLCDLDCDPIAVAEVLSVGGLLTRAVSLEPGVRIPGHVDGAELALRAVMGQQVSVAAARRAAARLAAEHGPPLGPLADAESGVVRCFPPAQALAGLSPHDLPMPASRASALLRLAGALAEGTIRLTPGVDRQQVSAKLLAMPGIGPWTVSYVRMRALCDPDAFLPSDLGLRRALEGAELPSDPRSVERLAEQWRPYRSYALQYLWSAPALSQDSGPYRRKVA
jgi:AraC family transcriptional regulator of adaptative response / DNA-3-methyladenine glycosylase II